MKQVIITIVAVFVAAGIAALTLLPVPAEEAPQNVQALAVQAQSAQSTESFASMLGDLSANDAPFGVDFVVDVPQLGSSITVEQEGDVLLEWVGSDYACFSNPGQSLDLVQCVPFSNIASVVMSRQ